MATDLRCSVTCISHFCHFSSEQKGHINRSRGQICRQIAGLASFLWWQDLTVASLAKLSCYWCLISPTQGETHCPWGCALCPDSLCDLLLSSLLLMGPCVHHISFFLGFPPSPSPIFEIIVTVHVMVSLFSPPPVSLCFFCRTPILKKVL